MRSLRSLANIAMLAAGAMGQFADITFDDGVRSYSPSPPRGKHKPRRHGQKLKSCRVKIGRRVRRKHRRAG